MIPISVQPKTREKSAPAPSPTRAPDPAPLYPTAVRAENDPSSPSTRPRVTVVGASAAGLFAACLLAKRGTPVEVLERSETLNPEARTLIVTSRMRGLLGEMADGCTVNQIRRFELFTDGRSAQVS